jgi:hypothetical protein
MSVRAVDESETGSANFFAFVRALSPPPALAAAHRGPRRRVQYSAARMHLRPPAFSHGFTSFLWGAGLGLFVWIGLLGVGVSAGMAFLVGFLAALGIFFYVLLFGADQFRR